MKSVTWAQFFSWIKYDNLEDLVSAISDKTNLIFSPDALKYECFVPITIAYEDINKSFLTHSEFPREKSFLTFCILLPIIILILALYRKCFEYQKQNQKKLYMTPYIFCIIVLLSVIPQYLLNIDWGRWMTATIICTFFGILYLFYSDCMEMKKSIVALSSFLRNHRCLQLLTLIYIASLDQFAGRGFLSQVNVIWNWFNESFHFL